MDFKELKVKLTSKLKLSNVKCLLFHIIFRSEGRFSIGSTGHKNMYVGLGEFAFYFVCKAVCVNIEKIDSVIGLDGLKLEAKAGIVGGSIGLGRIDTYCHLSEDNSTEPFHQVAKNSLIIIRLRVSNLGKYLFEHFVDNNFQMCIQLDVVEIRFDYMSTSVLMGRVSHLVVK